MVMGIIGYTQGVSDVRKPAVNANRKALTTPRPAASENASAWAVAGMRIAAPSRESATAGARSIRGLMAIEN
jgi:hypothetical protein